MRPSPLGTCSITSEGGTWNQYNHVILAEEHNNTDDVIWVPFRVSPAVMIQSDQCYVIHSITIQNTKRTSFIPVRSLLPSYTGGTSGTVLYISGSSSRTLIQPGTPCDVMVVVSGLPSVPPVKL